MNKTLPVDNWAKERMAQIDKQLALLDRLDGLIERQEARMKEMEKDNDN